MKKNNFFQGIITMLVLAFATVSFSGYSQEQENFYTIKNRMDAYYDSIIAIRGIDSMQGTGYVQYMRKVNYWEPRLYPVGDFNHYHQQLIDFAAEYIPGSSGSGQDFNWSLIGPDRMPEKKSIKFGGLGQIHCIEFDPNNTNNMFACSPVGGLWKSSNYGETWENAGTDKGLPRSGASWVAIDENDSEKNWFVATGSAEGMPWRMWWQDAIGVYRTTNGGENWENIGVSSPRQMRKIVKIPGEAGKAHLLVVTNKGVFECKNALMPIPVWDKILTGNYYDIELHPDTSTNLAFVSGTNSTTIWKIDYLNNDTLELQNLSFLPDTAVDIRRITIENSKAAPDYLFIAVSYYRNSNSYLYKYDLTNDTWIFKGKLPVDNLGGAGINPERAMGWVIAPVLNGDSNLIMLHSNTAPVRMTYDLLTNNTCSWIDVTSSYGQIETHVDMHCMNFDNYRDLWVGNDGGVYRSNIFDLPNKIWEEKNNGLAVTTVNYVASSELDRNINMSGQHDNGTNIYKANWGNNWSEAHVKGGDGMRSIFDYLDSQTLYVSHQSGTIYKSTNGGEDYTILSGFGGSGTWQTNYGMNTENPEVLYLSGNELPRDDSLWDIKKWGLKKYENGTWSRCEKFEEQIPIVAENDYANPSVWVVANTKTDPDYMYVSWRGNDTVPSHFQHVFKTTVGGDTIAGAWSDVGAPPVNVWISDIAVDDENPDHIFVSGSGYYGNYVFTVDSSGWQIYNNGIFHDGAKCLALVEGSPDKSLYVGTGRGLFYTNENMDTWIDVTGNLPNVGINDLEINYNKKTIVAGTWGRGVWEAPFECEYSSSPITILSDTTWATDQEIHSDIIIEEGGWLTIESVISMADDARILVKQGGLLYLDGGTLTNACAGMWRGVEVWGSPFLASSFPNQGFFIMKNGAVIENAIIGIKAGSLNNITIGKWVDDPYAGGIVRALNSTIRNNETGVYLANYPSINSTFLSSNFFTNTNFIVDTTYFFEYDTVCMAKLSQINNVKFNNCTFGNNTHSPYSGIGIHSFNSKFFVEGQKVGDDWENGLFYNLNYGIYAIASSTQYYADIRHTTFNYNFRGTYIGAMSNARVTSNLFQIKTDIELGAYCLYLDNSTGYRVEENTFEYPNSTKTKGAGLIINNSGDPENEIYNNNFNHLQIATSAQNCNRSIDPEHGLKIKCNDYSSNNRDILVISDSICENPGISKDQGAPGATDMQAGNTFSWINTYPFGPQYSDYDNLENSIITYYHHDPDADPPDIHIVPKFLSPEPTIDLDKQLTEYSKFQSCPPSINSGGGNPGEDIKSAMDGFDNQADSTQAILTALVDGGDSEVLEQQVLQSMPPETYDLYISLMGKSPYLSDSVLMAAIEKENVLPNVLIKDILVANPQAAKSDEVMQKVDEKAYPLSDEMLAEVLLGKYTIAAKEKLEAQVNWYKHNKAMALNRLKQYYLADTISGTSIDSLIILLESENGIQEKYELVFAYMQKGDWTNASSTLNAILSAYNLNLQQQQIYNDFVDYYLVLDTLYLTDTTYTGLSTEQEAILMGLADYADNRIGSYARNILISLGEYYYREPILLPVEELKSSTAIQITDPVMKSYPKVKLYPNPAKDYVVLEMLTGNLSGAEISLFDNLGKLVKRQNIPVRKQQYVVSLKGMKTGIYILQVRYEGKVLGAEKLTIKR